MNNVLFYVLLVFTFEYLIVCFSNISTIFFLTIKTSFYEKTSLFVIITLSLSMFIYLYNKLILVKKRSLFLFLMFISLNILNVYTDKILGQKMVDMNQAFLSRYLAYTGWISFLIYISKYILVAFLVLLSIRSSKLKQQ